MMLETWLAQGPYTLSLCSHFFGFYSHTAIVEQLYNAEFKPTKLTGTSAGALVAGVLASRVPFKEFKELLFSKTEHDYWDPKLGLGLLGGKKFQSLLQSLLVADFSQTVIPLAVGVAELPFLKMKFLASGNLPHAVLASCAVPFLFPPVKVAGTWYYDGGLLQKTGIDPQDKNERVLNVYLSSNVSHIQTLQPRKNVWGPNHRVLYLPRAPKVNFRNLSSGVGAYNETLNRAKNLLQREFRDNVITL